MRTLPAAVLLALVAIAIPFANQAADAQMTCYIKRCATFMDGSKFCDLTPVACEKL